MKRLILFTIFTLMIMGTPVSLAEHMCPKPGGQEIAGDHYEKDDKHDPPYYKQGDPEPCTIIGKISKGIGFSIQDIFGWSIGIGSIVALGVITYGGTKYAASGLFGEHASGDQVNEAKRWIFAGLKGLALLIGAYLIINTINPAILLF